MLFRSFRLAPETDARAATSTGTAADRKFATVQAAVAEAVAAWSRERMPGVKVGRTPAELPARARLDPRHTRARGLQLGEQVWLVTDNIPDGDAVPQALRDLAHEAIGHYGVDRIIDDFVPGGWSKLTADVQAMRTNPNVHPDVQGVMDEVQRRYQDADGRVDPTEYAREVVAVMAERGLRNGITGRIVAAIDRKSTRLNSSH